MLVDPESPIVGRPRMPEKPRILILTPYFLPGYRAGGPILSIAGLLDHFTDDFDFRIITRDRDLRAEEPYGEITPGTWLETHGVPTLYLRPDQLRARSLARTLNQTPHDLLYLNSLFTYDLSILPIVLQRSGVIESTPVVIAPRGELDPGALRFNAFKKASYLLFARALRLYRGVTWQASSPLEAKHIRRFAKQDAVVLAPNLPPKLWDGSCAWPVDQRRVPPDADGPLRVVYLSRIGRKKNLRGALGVLKSVREAIHFDVFGPIEDRRYWQLCERDIAELPANVRVAYRGIVPLEQVTSVLADYDLFFLPTYGENFGWAILQALGAGCPVLISDRTPWRDLEGRGAGWDLPLRDPRRFAAVIEGLARATPEQRRTHSRAARALAGEASEAEDASRLTKDLFLASLR
jgi:glycosyltransferase involved in cell wall biosynthesis